MRVLPAAWLVLTCLGCSPPVPPSHPVAIPATSATTGERAARIEAISQELVRRFNKGEEAEGQVPAFQERMMVVAGEGIDDACGREALLWVLAHGHFSPAAAGLAGRAADLLIAHHLTHPDMKFACSHIAGLGNGAEDRLRAIRTGTPDRATRGAALLSLADVLITRGNAATSTAGREKVHREAVECLEGVKRGCADARLSERSDRYRDRADRLLDQVRRLAVGCPAPAVEGETLDGEKVRLSEYRGRVVMLVFGKAECSGCVALYPRQRVLQERLAGRPFAVVGVHAGEEKDAARVRDALARHKVGWPVAWSRGPVGQSPIETL